ncbi:MAG: DUF5675 family protein [Candidatus Auribacterota bacterium]|jgi:hypothetical protein|nr:DUF5675 family protein [Candidatus Auribacterota bacterium]
MLDESGDIAFQCASLELPWMGNMPNVSCIPTGNYSVTRTNSPRFGNGTLSVNNVHGRSHILIHQGNFTRDIEGCILLGEKFADIDNNDITDVVNSRATIDRVKKLAVSFELTIIQI